MCGTCSREEIVANRCLPPLRRAADGKRYGYSTITLVLALEIKFYIQYLLYHRIALSMQHIRPPEKRGSFNFLASSG